METRSDEVWGRSSVSSSHLSEDTNLHGGESFFFYFSFFSRGVFTLVSGLATASDLACAHL